MGRSIVEDAVVAILTDIPETRANDDLLYCSVLKRLGAGRLNEPAYMFFRHRADRLIPPFETIRRSRQLIQSKHEELRPSKEQQEERKRLQHELRAYYSKKAKEIEV